MIASISNIAKDATITATPDSALQDINVITDGDYSSVYTDALAGEIKITFIFPVETDIGYIAIGGSNIAKKDSIKITSSSAVEPIYLKTVNSEQLVTSDLFDLTVSLGGTIDDSALELNHSSVMMYKTDITGARRVDVVVRGAGTISVAEIAMGDYYTIPRGEQGGYKKAWSVPNIKARSSVGLDNSPINLSYESRSLKCRLSVPNNIMLDFEEWYDFIDFASNNTFYILEDINKFHAYAGFNALADMTSSHGESRLLGSSSISFSAFAKSTEALF